MPPYQSAPPAREDERTPRPKLVDHAVWLTLAGASIGAVGTVVRLTTDRAQLQAMLDEITEGVPDAPQIPFATVVVGAVVGVLLLLGLFALLAFLARGGRNWARVALAVLAAMGAAGFLLAVAADGPAPVLMWDLADIAFRVAAVVYLFRPESTAYFLQRRKR
ncbi:hypothetical protein BJP25_29535 [Actinokineospora bangkokensis]|uniref:DUF2127 domain-containing protein n=2 Tax=Actinokineospora bangkokensis TaxID=1193682 RepID=A0A1Q9LFC4_9PSEU|nr:hypothetical protein BJP25_29535 [Actinokineospora bangkokensis]